MATEFKKPADIKSLVHCIGLQGPNLIGAEIGVFQAHSFCTLLQTCPNIKVLHGIDTWEPFVDYLKEPYDGNVAFTMDQKGIELVEFTARHNIKYSGFADKAIIHKLDSNDAVKLFEDYSLDFIFLDAYLTYEQAKNDLEVWYQKVKLGGLFSGHDYNCSAVSHAIKEFREENNITNHMSIFDNAWVWRK